MTKDRFLELLNLYLDNEISLEEEESFMRELRFNPERYEMYLEYCKLNNACVAVGDSFSETPRQRRSLKRVLYGSGGLAAAVALLALAGQNLLPMLNPQASTVPVVTAGADLAAPEAFAPVFEMESVRAPSVRIAEGPAASIQLASTSVFETESSEMFKQPSPKKTEATESLPWKKGLVLSSDPSIESLDHERLFTIDNPIRPDAHMYALPQNAFGGISEEFEFDFARVSFGEAKDFNVRFFSDSAK